MLLTSNGHTDPCAETGWVKIYHASMTASPAGQEQVTKGTIDIARKFQDADLETLALALYGSALVAQTKIQEGMDAIDEAMTAVTDSLKAYGTDTLGPPPMPM